MADRIFRIYKITNTVTGKSYVGVTIKTIEKRFAQHWDHARRANSKKYFLHKALIKYGRDAFVIIQIAEAYSEREAIVLERAMITTHQTMAPNGYNLSTGGEGGSGWNASPEMRKRMSESRVGYKWSKEQRAKMSVIQKTPEYRAKMRANSAKGIASRKPITDAQRIAASERSKIQFSNPAAREDAARKTKESFEKDPTLRARISATLTGRKMPDAQRAQSIARGASPEFRAKIRASLVGRRKRTPEENARHKIKMAEKWADPEFRAKQAAGMKRFSEDRRRLREQKAHAKIERKLFDQYNLLAGAP